MSTNSELLRWLEELDKVRDPSALEAPARGFRSAVSSLGEEASRLCLKELQSARWDSSPIVLHFLLSALADYPAYSAIGLLGRLLLEPADRLPMIDKQDVVEALCACDSPEVSDLLMTALSADDVVFRDDYGSTRVAVIERLAAVDEQRAIPLLERLTSSEIEPIAESATAALAKLKRSER